MRHLQLAIDAGEKNCARERGKWCRFMGSSHLGSNPLCLLFRDERGEHRQLRDANGGIEGWLQRLPECLAAEQGQVNDTDAHKQPRTGEGRHDKVFAAVVRSGDDAAKLIDRLTVESFGYQPTFEREVIAFRKLNTSARLSAARSFIRRGWTNASKHWRKKPKRSVLTLRKRRLPRSLVKVGLSSLRIANLPTRSS